jgi:hypothetical protein
MEKLIYVILGFGVAGNIAVYYALHRARKHGEQCLRNKK